MKHSEAIVDPFTRQAAQFAASDTAADVAYGPGALAMFERALEDDAMDVEPSRLVRADGAKIRFSVPVAIVSARVPQRV